MIATLATLGLTHGGNGAKAVSYLLDQFEGEIIKDPFQASATAEKIASKAADSFKKSGCPGEYFNGHRVKQA